MDPLDCRRFDALLDALLQGSEESVRADMDAHAAGCPRCRELLALATAPLDAPAVPPPDDLADSILRRTSGRACNAAEGLLCALVDGALGETDAELTRLHVATCPSCAATVRALVCLRDELPAMAERDPGRAFTAGVVARTSGSWRRRVAARFQALLVRPTFAWEGAYLGSLVLVGLASFPGSPLRDLPKRTSQAVVALPASVRQTAGRLEDGTRGLDARVGSVVQEAERRAARVAVEVAELRHRVERKFDRAIDKIENDEKNEPKETP